jgi:ribosome modulation factor
MDKSQSWKQGYFAFKMGRGIDTNPYSSDYGSCKEWKRGWREAKKFFLNKNRGKVGPFEGIILKPVWSRS